VRRFTSAAFEYNGCNCNTKVMLLVQQLLVVVMLFSQRIL
jgi:hypothetical protein